MGLKQSFGDYQGRKKNKRPMTIKSAEEGKKEKSTERAPNKLEEVGKLLKGLQKRIEAKGYEFVDKSSQSRIEIEIFYDGKLAGMIYSNLGGDEIHVTGHYMAGAKELKTKFLKINQVNETEILDCFK